jgi:hypothetical protein
LSLEIVLRVLVPKSGVWEEMQQITLHLNTATALRPASEAARAEPSPQPVHRSCRRRAPAQQ